MLFLPHNANILLSALIFNSRSIIYTLLLPCYSFSTNQLWQLSVSPMRGDLQTSMLTTTGSRVFFDIKIGDTDAGRVAFELVSFPIVGCLVSYLDMRTKLTFARIIVRRWYGMIFFTIWIRLM